jgi:hypothetical protein
MALGSGGIAAAEDLSPEQARAFVVDKLFDYTCFDGTAGMVRIFSDGSVVGTIRSGQGETRFTTLPEGTIRSTNNPCARIWRARRSRPVSRWKDSITAAFAVRLPV